MRVTLVTCFNADWQYGRLPHPYIPLNLIGLGTSLQEHGHTVTILDQTLALMQGKATDGPHFHHQIAELIHGTDPDVIGFTTMCNSYPQTLTLARHCREMDPAPKLVLGGPQATAVDVATLEKFPWIDVVVRGEADFTFPALVDHWGAGNPTDTSLAGISWRQEDGQIICNPQPPLFKDMDVLPFPDFSLYPVDAIRHNTLIPIEAGRGCPFECTFCSTNLFFSRRYRIKSPDRLIAEMNHLYTHYGYNRFDLVHDMITVDVRWIHQFCEGLIEGGHDYIWGCSARVDCVTEELIDKMAEAGCVGIFFGIETGSQRLQPIVKKKLHVETVMPMMKACLKNDIKPTASFITGFPNETVADAMDSLHMALDVIHLSPETRGQMHLLAPLVGSPLYAKHKDELIFDGHSSDISLFLLSDDEIQAVEQHPDVFPNFYYIPTPYMDRNFPKAVSASLYGTPILLIALRHAGADLENVLREWVAWQVKNVDPATITQDYYLYHFGLDFARYLRERVEPELSDAPYLKDIIEYFTIKYSLQRGHLNDQTIYRFFDYDVLHLAKIARQDTPWSDITPQTTGVLFINLALSPNHGFVYLEVPIKQTKMSVVQPGDKLEIRDYVTQLNTRPHLIVRNNTQKRIFTVKHHLDSKSLQYAGLAA